MFLRPLVEQRIAEDRARLAALRSAISVGDADIEAGRSKVFKGAALSKHLAALSRAARKGAARPTRRK